MKKIAQILLLLCILIVIYFFIKEQFRGINLSHRENMILSITYLVTGISVFILYRIKYLENKNQGKSSK
jgi:hypothetical protein